MDKKIPVIYIIGSGHCGSTLLDFILDSHSKIFGVGELEAPHNDVPCACGQEFQKCSIWGSILKKFNLEILKIQRKKIDFLLNREKYQVRKMGKWGALIDVENYLKYNELLYKEILKLSRAKVIVDSSEFIDRAELLAKNSNIELLVIHLVRDGGAVTWSYMKKYSKALPFMLRWATFNIKAEILRRRSNFKFIFVRYEDLVRNPERVIKKILHQVGLEYEPKMLHFGRFIHHQVRGYRPKLNKNTEIKEDVDWKQKMPKRYKIMFNLLFGWLNLIYRNRRKI